MTQPVSPLDADLARWIAWRNEPRGKQGKPTKVPYGYNAQPAKADDETTWLIRPEAEKLARRIVNGQGGGIGFELGDIGNDLYIAGIDLDSCLHDRTLAPWAAAIVEVAETYAETSPSGNGIKAFFYILADDVRWFLDQIGVAQGIWGCRRGIPGEDPRDHGPAIEIYCKARYFAVTENLWPGAPDTLHVLDRDDLERLAALIPPPAKSAGTGKAGRGGDNSRSAAAFRLGRALRRAGKTFEEMCKALRADPETAQWCREKGEAAGGRELKRIWKNAADNQTGGLPVIQLRSGERHIAAEAGLDALHRAGVEFYQRGRLLIRVGEMQARSTTGDVILVPGILKITAAILDRALGQAATWQRFDPKTEQFRRVDPPKEVVGQILDMVGEWPFPPLAGIVGCPTLRPDGSILATEGYDPATGLVLKSAVAMPSLPAHPTRADAERAAALLVDLLGEFPFSDEGSRAVGLSMLMTPVLRGAMPVAPMHLVTAPQAGTGKSYLADIAAMIATGERAAAQAVAPTAEETEKRLVGAALSGYPIIGLDNCSDTLEGDFLCQVTERPLLAIRPLGSSDQHRITNTFTVLANGNNAAVADDLVRRTICCGLDANTENPELREFTGDPLAAVARDRGAYVAACLTIARAYVDAGLPSRLPRLASFDAWSDLVRSPLIWLGFGDPVETIVAARNRDPVRQDRERVFGAWKTEIGIGAERRYTVSEVIDLASERFSSDGSFRRRELHAVLIEIAQGKTSGAPIEPRRLGRWLAKHENTIAAGVKLVADSTDKRRIRFWLQGF